jgi:hypothetical protein
MKSQDNNAEDHRVQEILNLIYELAAGNLETRGTASENEDDLDGIITGLNMLAEEIADSVLKIKKLSGLLPICAWCKKLKDDEGYWKSVEQYIGQQTKAEFTHGMCPECQQKFFSEYYTGEYSEENNNSVVN